MEEISDKSYKSSSVAQFSTVKGISVNDAIASAHLMGTMGNDRVLPRQVATGTYRGQQSVGSQALRINSSEGNITLNDGQFDRLVIGIKENGFA